MPDTISKEKRSWNMSRIRSKNTKPELIVRSMLHNYGIRFRIHTSDLPGKPDISNKKKKFVIFVNGCFWHQHKGCKRASIPKSIRDYWLPKFEMNQLKFKENKKKLLDQGWKIVIVWECETKNEILLKSKLKPLII